MLILYLSAVVVAIILRRQERRHQLELMIAYQRLGMPLPLHRPKLQKSECWLNLVLGGFLTVGGTSFLAIYANMVREHLQIPTMQWEFSATMLAAGITLFILGARSLQENKNYERALRDQKTV